MCIRDSIRATLSQIRHSLAAEKRSTIWHYIFSLLGLTVFATLAILFGYLFFSRYYFTLKQRVIDWVMHILPESVRSLMSLPPPPEAAA